MKQISSPYLKFLSAAYLTVWEIALIIVPLQVGWSHLALIKLSDPYVLLTGGMIFVYLWIIIFTSLRYRHFEFFAHSSASTYRSTAIATLVIISLYSVIWLTAKYAQLPTDWPELARVWGVAVAIYLLHPRFTASQSK